MSVYIVAALVLWLIGGLVLGLWLGPILHRLPPRVSDDELVRHAIEQDAELDRRGLMQ